MKKILFILLISFTSCVVPQHVEPKKCCDKHTYYKTHYQPARIVVIKKNKPIYRSVKVRVNKHRKRK